MIRLVTSYGFMLALEGALVLLLTAMPRLGPPGKNIADACTRAPALDGVMSLLIWVPWVVGSVQFGGLGLVGTLLAQFTVLQLWVRWHEWSHPEHADKPCIAKLLTQHFGWWQNHLALWVTMFALPIFFAIRLAEITIYPLLIRLLKFPVYEHRDWINVSRQKFDGLVGHDLVWCWYCDWMTGVYSLGGEMLRNVESLWCPIRFYDGKKCENCRIDFPDIDNGWVPADGTMTDVVQTLEEHMGDRHWSWFGHPGRSQHR